MLMYSPGNGRNDDLDVVEFSLICSFKLMIVCTVTF